MARINRSLRPDIKVLYTNPQIHEFSNSAISDTYIYGWFGQVANGNTQANRVGDKIFVKNFNYRANVVYYNDFELGNPNDTASASIRFLFLQCRTPNQFNVSNNAITNFLTFFSGTGDNPAYQILALSPLRNNITESYAVLLDKRYVVTDNKPHLLIDLNVPLKWKTLRYQGASTDNYPNHGIMLIILVSGLKWQASLSENVRITDTSKLVFTETKK